MMDLQEGVMLSPRAGRNFLDSRKCPSLAGFWQLFSCSKLPKLTERSAKRAQTGVENPWNSFAFRPSRAGGQ